MEKKITTEQLVRYKDLIVNRNDLRSEIANTYSIIVQQQKRSEHMVLKLIELDNNIEALNQELIKEHGEIMSLDMNTGAVTTKEGNEHNP